MKNKRMILVLSCLGLCGVAVPLAIHGVSASISASENTNVEIAEVYAKGSTIRLPEGSTFDSDGKTARIEKAYLTYPSGLIASSRTFLLNDYGAYSLLLQGTCDGQTISATKLFTVSKDYYSTTLNGSSIDYDDLNKNFGQQGYYSGLKVSLAEGDTFSYAKPINVYENTWTNLLYWNVVQIDPLVHYVTTRLTDAYDASNYIEITWHRGSIYYECWIGASVKGGTSLGFEEDGNGSVSVGDDHYSLSQYGGTWIHANNKINGAYVNVNYQLDTTDRKNIKIYAETDTTRKRYLVSELNNEKAYIDHFDGFTTGDVYLSMTASTFDGVTVAPIEIASIGDAKGDDLLPMDFYRDTTAPLILFDKEYDQAQIVAGVPLKLPTPVIKDDTAVRGTYSVNAYYGKGTGFERNIPIVDGAFTPSDLGTYTIVYSAYDTYGNERVVSFDFYCGASGRNGIELKVNPLSNVFGGERVRFDDFTSLSYNGEVSVTVIVTSPSGVVTTLDNPSDSLWISEIGEYSVEYEYSDLIYQGKLSYVFEAKNSGKSVFSSNIVNGLPSYLLSGYSYSVDAAEAYSFASGKAMRTAVKGYVSYDEGEFEAVDYTNFKIKDGASSLRFRFAIKDDASTYIESSVRRVVSVTNGNLIDPKAYFQGNWDCEPNEEGLVYSPKSSGTATLDFVNRVLFSQLRFDFNADENLAQKMTLTFQDFRDETKKTTLTLTRDGKYSLNGAAEKTLGVWMGKRISLSYNKEMGAFFVGENSIALPNPFSSDLCNLSISFEGVATGKNFTIYQFGNQPFNSSLTRDRVAPMTSMPSLPSVGQIHDTITVSQLAYADVLSPSPDSTSTMSAYFSTDDENIPLKDLNGVTLEGVVDFTEEHVVEFDRYGYYLVSYSCQDGKGNRVYGGLSQGVSVIDDIAPTIEFVSKPSGEVHVKAGDITPLEVVVSDNCTATDNLDVWYFAYDQYSRWIDAVRRGGTLHLSDRGRYTIYVSVHDEAGNSNYLSYVLVVD